MGRRRTSRRTLSPDNANNATNANNNANNAIAPSVPRLLLDNSACARIIGVSRNRFYELLRDPRFPAPVDLPVSPRGKRVREYRTLADIERYLELLGRRSVPDRAA